MGLYNVYLRVIIFFSQQWQLHYSTTCHVCNSPKSVKAIHVGKKIVQLYFHEDTLALCLALLPLSTSRFFFR